MQEKIALNNETHLEVHGRFADSVFGSVSIVATDTSGPQLLSAGSHAWFSEVAQEALELHDSSDSFPRAVNLYHG